MSIQKGVGRTITFGSIATAGTANTSTTPACVVDKDGAGQNPATNSPTHQGGGSWKIALTSAEMTADLVSFTATGSGLVPTYREIYTEADYTTARAARLDDLDAAISTRSTFAGGAVASVTAPVTAGTVSDKTGYSLATAPPTAADVTTAVVAGMATAPVGSVAAAVDANVVTVNDAPIVAFDGVLQAGSTTTATLASSSSTATDFYKGRAILFINTDQSAFIAAYNGSTKVATLDRTLAVALASGEEYSMSVPQAVGSVDGVQIEAGINMRQALAPILAASAGLVSGVGTGPILIKGAGTSTTRITATTDSAGNRTAITLNLP